jgi:hypothetical protein
MADSIAILCGLGNPGRRYRMTRHNLGFLVVERFVERNGGAPFSSKFGADYAECRAGGRRVLALLPQSYMNLSGDPLVQCANYFKVDRADLLVVCDDITLPFPEFRIRPRGGAGGHKGSPRARTASARPTSPASASASAGGNSMRRAITSSPTSPPPSGRNSTRASTRRPARRSAGSPTGSRPR